MDKRKEITINAFHEMLSNEIRIVLSELDLDSYLDSNRLKQFIENGISQFVIQETTRQMQDKIALLVKKNLNANEENLEHKVRDIIGAFYIEHKL